MGSDIKEDVNIVVGRFQPFTNGHLKCCTKVYKETGLKTVLCVIDTLKTDEKHPFLTKMMWSLFKSLAKKYDEIQDVLLVKNADIVKNSKILEDAGYHIKTWSCGTDRADAYRRISKYAPGVEIIEIFRTEEDVSGTQVRKYIKEGDKKRFEESTPEPVHKFFDRFKTALEEL